MTPGVRRYTGTGFVFRLAGLVPGGWDYHLRVRCGSLPAEALHDAHVQLLHVGFMLMMVMAVAIWIFPRPVKDDHHCRPEVAEATG